MKPDALTGMAPGDLVMRSRPSGRVRPWGDVALVLYRPELFSASRCLVASNRAEATSMETLHWADRVVWRAQG